MKKKDLLLVIDMQNVYMPGQEWECPSMPRSIDGIIRLLDSETIGQVAFTKFQAPEQPVGTWQRYNQEYKEINEDPFCNELVAALQPYAEKYPVFVKSVYSSFKIEELIALAKQSDRVLLSGVVAECCVSATLLEGIDLGFEIIYLTDCISGQSRENEESIRKLAESFSPMHVQVTDSKTYLD